MICAFYLKGTCVFGDQCRYSHTAPTNNQQENSLSFASASDPETSASAPDPKPPELGFTELLQMEQQVDVSIPQLSQSSDDNQQSEPANEKLSRLSLAIRRSKNMVCCVCIEEVYLKSGLRERCFGILSDCNHCFCLTCIRKWRSIRQSDGKLNRSCPVCRVPSKFFIPSRYWVEDEYTKQKVIQRFKDCMRSRPCRFFKEGGGRCSFGTSCLYKHEYSERWLRGAQSQRRWLRANNRTWYPARTRPDHP